MVLVMGQMNLASKILAASWPRIFGPSRACFMLPQKILKIESLSQLAKTQFQHEKYEHRYSVIRYWM